MKFLAEETKVRLVTWELNDFSAKQMFLELPQRGRNGIAIRQHERNFSNQHAETSSEHPCRQKKLPQHILSQGMFAFSQKKIYIISPRSVGKR